MTDAVQIVEMPQPLGIFSRELFDRGLEYFEAFQVLAASDNIHTQYPQYFMVAHATEVFMKAFLAANRVPKKELRFKLSHQLDKIVDECGARGLPSIYQLRPFVLTINAMNRDFDFRYPTSYNLHVPSPKLCDEILSELRDVIRPTVGAAWQEAQFDFAFQTAHLKGKQIRWSD